MSLQQRKAATYAHPDLRPPGGRAGRGAARSRPLAGGDRGQPERLGGAEDSSQISVSASAGTPTEARDLANAAVFALGEVIHEVENAGSRRRADLVRLEPSDEALLPGRSLVARLPAQPADRCAGAGLVLGYAVALLRRTVDRKVRTVAQRRGGGDRRRWSASCPVAGPLSRRSRGVREDLGVVAEAFRQLRTNLRFVDVDHPPRSIVVTSANAARGQVDGLLQPGPDDGRGRAAHAADRRRPAATRAWPRPSTSTPPSG